MQQIITLQVIAGLFALFALSRVYLRFQERKLSSFAFVFWVGVWFAGVTAIFFPELTSNIAEFLGIGRGVDVIVYASIVIIFYLLFRIYIKIEDTQRQITEVVRKAAIEKELNQSSKTSRR